MMSLYPRKRSTFSQSVLLGCLLWVIALSCGGKSPTNSQTEDKWTPRNTGLENLLVQFLAVHPINSDIIFAGTFDGLYKSTDGAQTWARVDSGWAHTEVTAIAFDALDPEVMYVGTGWAGVLKSEDGGKSWEVRNNGLGDLAVFGVATDPQHSDTLYAGCEHNIYRSYDGAAQWRWVHFWDRVFLAIDPQNSQFVYAGGKQNYLFKSQDGGQSWSKSCEGLKISGTGQRLQWVLIDPIDPRILYVGSSSIGIYKSTNAALDWAAANGGLSGAQNVRAIVLDFSNPDLLYAATNNGVFRSTDGAETWQQMNEGLTNVNVKALALNPLRPHVLYAGTWGEGVFVWKTQ